MSEELTAEEKLRKEYFSLFPNRIKEKDIEFREHLYTEWLEYKTEELQKEVERLNKFKRFTEHTVNIIKTMGLDHNQKDSSLITIMNRGEELLKTKEG